MNLSEVDHIFDLIKVNIIKFNDYKNLEINFFLLENSNKVNQFFEILKILH